MRQSVLSVPRRPMTPYIHSLRQDAHMSGDMRRAGDINVLCDRVAQGELGLQEALAQAISLNNNVVVPPV